MTFFSPVPTPPLKKQKTNRTKPNLTQPPSVFLPDETLTLTLRKYGYFRAVGTGKREEEAVSRGKRCPARFPAGVFLGSGGVGSSACSASGKSFGRGPRPRWPAGREHCPTGARISPVGKREELRTRTACRERPAGRDRWATGDFRVLAAFFVGLARLDR